MIAKDVMVFLCLYTETRVHEDLLRCTCLAMRVMQIYVCTKHVQRSRSLDTQEL